MFSFYHLLIAIYEFLTSYGLFHVPSTGTSPTHIEEDVHTKMCPCVFLVYPRILLVCLCIFLGCSYMFLVCPYLFLRCPWRFLVYPCAFLRYFPLILKTKDWSLHCWSEGGVTVSKLKWRYNGRTLRNEYQKWIYTLQVKLEIVTNENPSLWFHKSLRSSETKYMNM